MDISAVKLLDDIVKNLSWFSCYHVGRSQLPGNLAPEEMITIFTDIHMYLYPLVQSCKKYTQKCIFIIIIVYTQYRCMLGDFHATVHV